MEKHGLILIAVVVLLVLWVAFCHFYYTTQFKHRVEALGKEGYLVSLDDLEKAYVLLEGIENAADIYIEAFLCYQGPNEFENEYLPIRGNYCRPDDVSSFPPEVMDALASSLKANQKTLKLFGNAVKIEHCSWPRKLAYFYLSNEYLTQIKECVQLLCEHSLYLSQSGEIEKLLESLHATIAISQTLSKQPFLIDHLVSNSLKSIVTQNLEDILNQTDFTESQLSDLQSQFANLYDPDSLSKAFTTEQVGTITFWQLPTKEQIKLFNDNACMVLPPKIFQRLYSLTAIKKKDALLSLDYYKKYNDSSQLPLHERKAAFEKISNEMEQLPFWHIYLNIGFVSYTTLNNIDLRVLGSLKCAETALAIEGYRLKHNALPELLEHLVPDFMEEVPREPFDNEVLRYIKHDDGYTVYAIGEDGVDNGGLSYIQMAEQIGEERPEEFDWPFTVKRHGLK